MKEPGGSSNFQNQSAVELEKTLFEKSKSKVGVSWRCDNWWRGGVRLGGVALVRVW